MPPDVMVSFSGDVVTWLYVVNIGHRFFWGVSGVLGFVGGDVFVSPRHAMRLANLPILSYMDPFSILQVSCHVTSNNEMLAKHEDGRLNWDASLTLPELPRSWRRFFP